MPKKQKVLMKNGKPVKDNHGDLVYEGQAFVDIFNVFHANGSSYNPPDYSNWNIYHDNSQVGVNPYTPPADTNYQMDYPPEVLEANGPAQQDLDYLTRQQFYQIFSHDSTLGADLLMIASGINPETGSRILPYGTPGTFKGFADPISSNMTYEAMDIGSLTLFNDDGSLYNPFMFSDAAPFSFSGSSNVPSGLTGQADDWVYNEYRKTGKLPDWQKTFGTPGGGLFGLTKTLKAWRNSKKSWGDIDLWQGPKE